MMDHCLITMESTQRRFGTATDNEIKACFARFMESLKVVASTN